MTASLETKLANDPAARGELVERLLACRSMRDEEVRRQVMGRLDHKLLVRVTTGGNSLVDVDRLVSTCADYMGGIEQLRDALEFFEADSIAMAAVDDWLACARGGVGHDPDGAGVYTRPTAGTIPTPGTTATTGTTTGTTATTGTTTGTTATTGTTPDTTPDTTTDVPTRIARAEVSWIEIVDEVTGLIERDEAVVVLAPRHAGSATFSRQLCAHLGSRYPSWTVRRLSARTLAGESVDAYMERMRAHIPVTEGDSRLVICIHGFSRSMAEVALSEHMSALGNQLRGYLEQSGVTRPFSLVAVGGYPLFLLRYGDGQHSALNRAREVALPELTTEQIADLMAQIEPGRFSATDAAEVAVRTGGHPHMVKTLLSAWYDAERGDTAGDTDARWHAAEEALEEDADYLHPTLAAVASEAAHLAELRAWMNAERVKRKLMAHWPGHYLLYTGLLRQQGRYLYLRCPVVARLVHELLEEVP